jgi:hypothetical protein
MIARCLCPICRMMLIESLPEEPAWSDSCPIVFLRPYWDMPGSRFAANPDASTVNGVPASDDAVDHSDS